ncbi:MAG: hypothetical protein EOL92_00420 [Bacteroidia bacterium]|nr:hypothetical protein [Bacteroidia bacterium]
MTPAEIHTLVGLLSACVGLASGIAVGAWTVAVKNKDLESHGEAIREITIRCARQKEVILNEVKAAICDAMKVALRDLRDEMREKQVVTERDLAVVSERVSQTERDIDDVFNRLRELEKKK